MTLKCGSLNSFFIAALRTPASTPRATNGEKSDACVSAATSSSVGNGGGSGTAVPGDAAPGAVMSAVVGSADSTVADDFSGAAGASATAVPLRDPALRRDQRDRKPSPAVTCAPRGR